VVQRKGAGCGSGQDAMDLEQGFHDGATKLEGLLLARLGTRQVPSHDLGGIGPDGGAQLIDGSHILLVSRSDAVLDGNGTSLHFQKTSIIVK
jgi:hypothetical protein